MFKTRLLFLFLVVLSLFATVGVMPIAAQYEEGEVGPVDVRIGCLRIAEDENIVTAKCCGCTLAEFNAGDVALVVTAMAGLALISKRFK